MGSQPTKSKAASAGMGGASAPESSGDASFPSGYKKVSVTTPHPFTRLNNPSNWERARMVLGILSGLVFLRLLLIILVIFVVGSGVVVWHYLGFPSLCVYTLRFGCKLLLILSGHFWIPVNGDPKVFKAGNCPRIIVSNHISNMEILHLLTLSFKDASGNPVPPAFVTKATVFEIPVVGTITRDVLGSIGVARKKKTDAGGKPSGGGAAQAILERVEAIARAPERRGPIVIFAEGTTTNGTCLLGFQKGAFRPLVKVTPVLYAFGAEAYPSTTKPTPSAFLPTYDSIWGPAYLWRLLCQPFHSFSCEFLDSVDPPTAEGSAPVGDEERDALAAKFSQEVQWTMAAHSGLPVLDPEYNYRHKLQYHGGLTKAFVEHPKGPVHAMCWAPVQKVSEATEESGTPASGHTVKTTAPFDVVLGTKLVRVDSERREESSNFVNERVGLLSNENSKNHTK